MVLREFLEEWERDNPYIQVKTSGSTGRPKPMQVEKRRMLASARATCDFLGLQAGDTALLCMSLDYIAGKMMVVRALERNLRLISTKTTGRPLQDNTLFAHECQIDLAAMVPLQVYNSLRHPQERHRLMQIRHLLIGGGAVDDRLAHELKGFPHHVWSTYGMTETLSHIALRPLNGPQVSDWYTPFKQVKVSLNEESCLVIDAPELCEEQLVTNDIAELSSNGFRIIGRRDNVIDSGGIKVQAEEVERLLQPYLRAPFIITSRPDHKFGEAVVLLTEGVDLAEVRRICMEHLPKYYVPRHIFHVDNIPMTETGKPARKLVRQLACGLQ